MHANLYRRLLLISVCLWTASAGAAVTVSFVKPERYTDMGWYGDEASTAMKEIGAHLKQLGERYLPPGQLLKIEVLDVDLAGNLRFSSRSGREARILLGKADWPRIKLHYVLESDGRVLLDQQEDVADMGYLQRPGGPYSGGFLQYEKRMLDDWFKQRFATHQR